MDIKDEKSGAEKLITWMSGIVGGILLIALVIIKINSPSFKLLYFIISIVALIAIFGGIILVSWFIDKKKTANKKESIEKLPSAITYEQAAEIARKATRNPQYAEYINGCLGEGVEQLGRGVKSSIYWYKASGYYRGNTIYVLINMHYPNEKRAILIDPTPLELAQAKMSLAVNPETAPSVREITTHNPILGTEQRIVETIKEDDKEKVKESKEESSL